jgi:hypothetical protein
MQSLSDNNVEMTIDKLNILLNIDYSGNADLYFK